MEQPRKAALGGNTNTSLIKIIALVFMFIDHAGKMCFPAVAEMRLLGRIAFPLYCWCLVVGACHTRSMGRYALRLALVGLVSQPLYMVALHHPVGQYNIFLTLLLALLGLWGIRERKFLSHIWAPVLALAAAHLLGADYGWRGVMLVFLLYAAREKTSAIAAVMIAFCLYWGGSSAGVTAFFGLSLNPLTRSRLGGIISPFLKLQALALLALPFMLIPMRKVRLRIPTWLGYALYPLHLVLLIALEAAMGKTIHVEHIVNAWNQFIALF